MTNQHQLSVPLMITYLATFIFIAMGGILLGLVALETTLPTFPAFDRLYGTLVAIILLSLGVNCLLVATFLHQGHQSRYRTLGRKAKPRDEHDTPARVTQGDPVMADATTHATESDDESQPPVTSAPNPARDSPAGDAEPDATIRSDADTTITSTTDATDDADDDEGGTDPEHDPHAPFKPDS